MKFRTAKMISMLAGLSLLGGACGGGGTSQFPGLSQFNGFRVKQTDPQFNQEMVPLGQMIRILFTEAVDPNSLAGNIQVNEILTGGVSKDITSETAISPIAENTVAIQVSRQLVYGARYTVNLNASIRSLSGRPLQQFVLPFTTGSLDGLGIGGVSKPGPPAVSDMRIFQGAGICLGVTIDFSEDLVQLPVVDGQECPFFGNCGGGSTPMVGMVNPYNYNNSSRSFVFTFLDGGCDCSYYTADMQISVTVRNAIDLQGEELTPPYNKRFSAVSGFLSSDYKNMCY